GDLAPREQRLEKPGRIRQSECQRTADQHAVGPGDCRELGKCHASGVEDREPKQRHQDRAREGECGDRTPGANRPQEQNQRGTPEQVVLLFDRQRPRVAEWRESDAPRKKPICDVEADDDERQPVRTPSVERKERDDDRAENERNEQRGEQSQRAPCVEMSETDRSRCVPFADEQRGYEVSAQTEEHVHAEEPSAVPRCSVSRHERVVRHDRQNRKSPYAVELRPVAETLAPGLGSRAARRRALRRGGHVLAVWSTWVSLISVGTRAREPNFVL